MSLIEEVDRSKLPQHVAIIMDGNGRWARSRGENRGEGHREGVVSVRKIVEAAVAIDLKYLTVYTFSTENWSRPDEEVKALMSLMVAAIYRETPDLMKNNVRLMAIGDMTRLPEDVRNTLSECIRQTSVNTGTTLILALSYSSRWEIVQAVERIADDVQSKNITVEDIDENLFSLYLTTYNLPDPDLLIRTGGEKRISNFLLWQLSYAELYFTDVYWPDFREDEFYEAILSYQRRERRFGKTGDQITKS
ncbi:MAG: isoprenyl transferase [Tannerella sp.]|jgi:undecaprenyl diphosphate synthase|nr:isoprenyl transferase [Tannerella sp.]